METVLAPVTVPVEIEASDVVAELEAAFAAPAFEQVRPFERAPFGAGAWFAAALFMTLFAGALACVAISLRG